MELKQIITATVAVILICLVAIPLIDSSASTVNTAQNNVAEKYMMSESTTGEITIEATSTAGTYIINGESVTLTDGEYSNFWCILTDNLFVNLSPTRTWLCFEGLQTLDATLGTSGKVTVDENGWTVEIPSGAAAGTYNGTYEWICYPNDNGNYGLYRFTGNTYVDNDAMVFAIKENVTVTDGTMTNPRVIWSGSINGGTNTLKAWDTTTTPPTVVSDADVYIEYNEKGEISTQMSRVVSKYGDTSIGIATAIIPIEYHIITENDRTIITLLQLIPVLLIAALLLGIGYNIIRRD